MTDEGKPPPVTMPWVRFVLDSDQNRRAFREAGSFFVETVGRVPPHALDEPGLGEWGVRELIGHTCRALLTVEHGAGGEPGVPAQLARPADYFHEALRDRSIHDAIAGRAGDAAAALGEDPSSAVARIVDGVSCLVDSLPDDHPIGTPWGEMRLADYLPTRTFELVVHTLDLAGAVGKDSPVPESALSVAVWLATEIAGRLGRAEDLLMALTGRAPLPPNLLGLGPDS